MDSDNYSATPLPSFNAPITGQGAQGLPPIGGAGSVLVADGSGGFTGFSYNIGKENINGSAGGVPVSVQICINGSPYNIDIYSVDGTAYQGTLNYPPTHA